MHKIIHPESKSLFDSLVRHEKVREFFDSLQAYHRESYTHSLRVGLLAIDLGRDNKINDSDLQCLGYAGLLHDVEKVNIPLGLLSKKSPFDTEETEIVQEHPRLIFEKLQDFESDIIKQIVVAHHEYKQNPYPRKGNDRRTTNRSTPDRRQNKVRVHSLAQIVAIADMYDALVSPRSYKASLSKGATEKVLRQQFTGDPKYIDQALQRYKL